MKTIGLYIVSLLLSVQLAAQHNNLVLNPSFDDIISCPTGNGQIYLARHWYQPGIGGSSSELFHTCNYAYFYGMMQFQKPRTGGAYAGIGVFSNGPTDTTWMEYICGQLSEPLLSGKEYCVEFYVSLFDLSGFAIENMGIHFSRDKLSYYTVQGSVFPAMPQVEHQGGLLNDTINWMKVEGSFVAAGGEKHFIIGNFRKNSQSVFVAIPTGTFAAYYLIDDVSVWYCSPDTTPAVPEPVIPNVFTPNGDGYNDRFEITHAEYWDLQQVIYNRWGQILFESRNGSFWDGTYRGNPCAEGAYFYKIIARHPETGEEKEYLGSVTLFR